MSGEFQPNLESFHFRFPSSAPGAGGERQAREKAQTPSPHFRARLTPPAEHNFLFLNDENRYQAILTDEPSGWIPNPTLTKTVYQKMRLRDRNFERTGPKIAGRRPFRGSTSQPAGQPHGGRIPRYVVCL